MKKIIYSLSLVMLLSSCGFLDEYSQDLVVPKTVQDFDEVLLGNGYLTRKEVAEFNRGGLLWWLQLLDDDINTVMEETAVRGTFEMDEYYYGYTTWQLEVTRNYDGLSARDDNAEWEDMYRRINAMNIILNEIDDMPQMQEKDRLDAFRIKGESHFLRAQYYFLLVNIYANAYNPANAAETPGVPLKLTHYVEHDNKKETQFDRASVAAVYEQIILDLNMAVDYLKQGSVAPSHRVSKDAAQLFLSRVYLFTQNWEMAEKAASEVVKNKPVLLNYTTMSEELPVMEAGNPEILFSHGTLNVQNVITGRGGDFCVSSDLYELFEEGDYRKSIYFTQANISDSIALHRKYKRGLHISPISDLFTLRTSEAYLNLMEALAMQKKDGEAHDLLDEFRSYRLGYISYDVYTNEELIDEIRNERRKELCFEGHRWFDLRRYAVCDLRPFKKEIVRVYNLYNWNDRNKAIGTEMYVLEEDDMAYTFTIPKKVMEFDRGMEDNPRVNRKPTAIIPLDNNL